MVVKNSELKANDVVCLDLGLATPYKQKKAVIELLNANQFRVSFVLNKSVKLVLKDDKNQLDTYKCRTAFKLGIPVYHIDMVYEYIFEKDKSLFRFDQYLIRNKLVEKEFSNGKISAPKQRN